MSNLRDLDKNKILGQGGFGTVFEGVWRGNQWPLSEFNCLT